MTGVRLTPAPPRPAVGWWWQGAACAGRWELFEDPCYVVEAKSICHGCPVFRPCRAEADALEPRDRSHIPDIVLAGETRDERHRRRRRHRRSA